MDARSLITKNGFFIARSNAKNVVVLPTGTSIQEYDMLETNEIPLVYAVKEKPQKTWLIVYDTQTEGGEVGFNIQAKNQRESVMKHIACMTSFINNLQKGYESGKSFDKAEISANKKLYECRSEFGIIEEILK